MDKPLGMQLNGIDEALPRTTKAVSMTRPRLKRWRRRSPWVSSFLPRRLTLTQKQIQLMIVPKRKQNRRIKLMAEEKKQEKISIGERYKRVAQLMIEGKLPMPFDPLPIGISLKVSESLKETYGKKESQ